MNIRKVAAAVAVAAMISVGLPALNLAQDSKPDPWADAASQRREAESSLRETNAQLREQAKMIRDSAAQAAVAEKAAFRYKNDAEFQANHILAAFKTGAPLDLKIRGAAEQVQNAKDEATKVKATKELTELLDEYFEQDMNARGQELKDIQERLQKLQAQLDRRRAKKQEIINLQVKVALNEADGLGFYSSPPAGMFNFRVPAPVVVPFEAKFDTFVPSPPAPTPPLSPLTVRPTLEQGATGELVAMLQQTLNARVKPSLDIAVDSDFGPDTKSAVEKFQSQSGLKPTGVVDSATWKALEPLEQFIKPVPK